MSHVVWLSTLCSQEQQTHKLHECKWSDLYHLEYICLNPDDTKPNLWNLKKNCHYVEKMFKLINLKKMLTTNDFVVSTQRLFYITCLNKRCFSCWCRRWPLPFTRIVIITFFISFTFRTQVLLTWNWQLNWWWLNGLKNGLIIRWSRSKTHYNYNWIWPLDLTVLWKSVKSRSIELPFYWNFVPSNLCFYHKFIMSNVCFYQKFVPLNHLIKNL